MEKVGKITQIQGAVIDCEFPAGQLPELFEAVRVPRDGETDLILEVQNHLGNNSVRTVAMDAAEGLKRGLLAYATGASITVPVGDATLGRVFNVLGQPIDGGCASRHQPAVCYSSQSTAF
jgi:F-type H+-transporting ATPase subunit beta